jgi:hypothetical protein
VVEFGVKIVKECSNVVSVFEGDEIPIDQNLILRQCRLIVVGECCPYLIRFLDFIVSDKSLIIDLTHGLVKDPSKLLLLAVLHTESLFFGWFSNHRRYWKYLCSMVQQVLYVYCIALSQKYMYCIC